jgi:hypothetical protein
VTQALSVALICQAAHFGLDKLLQMAGQAQTDPVVYERFIKLEKVDARLVAGLTTVHARRDVSVLHISVASQGILLSILSETIEQVPISLHLTQTNLRPVAQHRMGRTLSDVGVSHALERDLLSAVLRLLESKYTIAYVANPASNGKCNDFARLTTSQLVVLSGITDLMSMSQRPSLTQSWV